MTRTLVLVLVLAGCNGSKSPGGDACRDRAHGPGSKSLETVKACAPLYAAACRDAMMAIEHVELTTLERTVAACRRAYPKLDAKLPADELFAHALDGTPRLHETDLAAIGHAIEVELRPPAVVLHLTSTSIAIEHGKTYEVTPTPEALSPVIDDIRARGGATGGLIVWGRYEAPEMFEALIPAFRDSPTVICQRDGANCR